MKIKNIPLLLCSLLFTSLTVAMNETAVKRDRIMEYRFFVAIEEGDYKTVDKYLNDHADNDGAWINDAWKGKTPLMFALEKLYQEEFNSEKIVSNLGYMTLNLVGMSMCLWGLVKLGSKMFDVKPDTWDKLRTDPSSLIANKESSFAKNIALSTIYVGGTAITGTYFWSSLKRFIRGSVTWLKQSDRYEIVKKIIEYPATNLTLKVNGKNAMDLLDDYIEIAPKKSALRYNLRELRKLMYARLNPTPDIPFVSGT